MTINLTLAIGVMSSQPGAMQLAHSISQGMGKLYWTASSQDIQLTAKTIGFIGPSGPVRSDTLHEALEKITGFQRNQSKVDTIGLLIADSYAPDPGHFGIMFDQAFDPQSQDIGPRTPREGCAVFLNGISRGRAPAERFEEGIFTAIHELGHVFNLQHSSIPSFMYQSAKGGLQPVAKSQFSVLECGMLARCSKDPHVWPGGSAFLDQGMLNASEHKLASSSSRCELTISSSKDVFYHFEPVELDVTLKARSGAVVTVPYALDAGYACFAIWIEEPDGARRKLQSPNHYCVPRTELVLDANRHFHRDISIFGESGGYTFRRAGRHRIWAVFNHELDEAATSNVIEVEVLPQNERSTFWRDGQSVLAEPTAARTLYYRRLTRQRMRAVKRLAEFSDVHRRDAATAMTRYAIGRALGEAALERRRDTGSVLAEQARHQLKLATRRPVLGDHRRNIAEELLENLSSRYRNTRGKPGRAVR